MNTLQLSEHAAPSPQLATFHEQEVLSFRLGDEEYAIPLRCVREIRSYQAPTRLAGSHKDLLGVIDLRGEIVPLLDLRRRFALPAAEFNTFTITIIVHLDGRPIGVVVDSVNDVVALSPAQIRAMPPMKGGQDQQHLMAIACVGERRLVLLHIESLLSDLLPDSAVALH